MDLHKISILVPPGIPPGSHPATFSEISSGIASALWILLGIYCEISSEILADAVQLSLGHWPLLQLSAYSFFANVMQDVF